MSEEPPPTPPDLVDWCQSQINAKLDYLRKHVAKSQFDPEYRAEWVRDLVKRDIRFLRHIQAEQGEKIEAFEKRMKEGDRAETTADQAGGDTGG